MDQPHAHLVSPDGLKRLEMVYLPVVFYPTQPLSGWSVAGGTWYDRTIREFIRMGWTIRRVGRRPHHVAYLGAED